LHPVVAAPPERREILRDMHSRRMDFVGNRGDSLFWSSTRHQQPTVEVVAQLA